MQTITDFPWQVTEDQDAAIVMPDGCRLSARIWRPEGAGPVPAILEYIPYRKRAGTLARDERVMATLPCESTCAATVTARG